ncbi:hypothetical protein GWK47_048978 [Chionoecetes opilio]|uniref:Uncharacterized protein n=1 Tax=Chionoecetes opilio TaxID=41210 RepID=A0A8J4Y436_CHIOP|nr:hypothetical protein GWK47_048978 [Chionoecetes opilio]
MDWVLGKIVDQSDCGASLGNIKITELVFADDAVIFAESEEALHEEAKALGFEVFWLKTKVQVFGALLDETVQSVHAYGENIEILETIHPLFKLPVVLLLNPEKVDSVISRLLFEVTEQAVLDTSEGSSVDEDEEEDFFKSKTGITSDLKTRIFVLLHRYRQRNTPAERVHNTVGYANPPKDFLT